MLYQVGNVYFSSLVIAAAWARLTEQEIVIVLIDEIIE